MAPPPTREWRKTIGSHTYLISTERSLIQLPLLRRGWADPIMYWTNPVPDADHEVMLDNSCNLGLYKITSPPNPEPEGATTELGLRLEQIGIGRLITDYMTLAYLTDVYIVPECQGVGLGRWMVACVAEVMAAMPQLRAGLLMTREMQSVTWYQRELGFKLVDQEKENLWIMMGKPKRAEEPGKGEPLVE